MVKKKDRKEGEERELRGLYEGKRRGNAGGEEGGRRRG